MSVFSGTGAIFSAALGEPVLYSPRAGESARSINAIFISVTEPVDTYSGVEVEARSIRAHVARADVPDVVHGSVIERGGQTYSVRGIDHDGKEMLTLMLAEEL